MAPTDRPDVKPGIDLAKLKDLRPTTYLVRFGLGAVISLTAAVISRAFGARLGGMFLAFPAILPASLTLIEEREGTRRADRDAIGAVLGGVGLAVFAGVGEALFDRVAPLVALVTALAAWVGTSFALYALLAGLRPDDCDRRMD